MTMPAAASADGALTARIGSLTTQISTKQTELQMKVNSALPKLPYPIQLAIKAAWNKLCSKLNEVWKFLNEMLSNLGDLSKLSSTGQAWLDDIGGPVSGKSKTIALDQVATDDNWTGDAATQYKNAIPTQQTALADMQSVFASKVNDQLSAMHSALVEFRVGMVAALIVYVGAFVAAIVAACTGVGIPAAIVTFIVACGVFLGACYGLASRLKTAFLNAKNKLADILNTQQSYPNGSWPVPTKGIPGTEGPAQTASQPAPTN